METEDNIRKTAIVIDKNNFERFYHLYWEKVYAVCYNNIKDREIAKEMVQDIFKSLWERKENLEINSVEHYLIRSAKLKTFEFIRNKVSRQKLLENNITFSSKTSSNCTEEHILFNNLTEKVNTLVETLPNQCKKVYKLSREQGLSNKEISALLLISERAVEYHITRALKTLRSSLSNY